MIGFHLYLCILLAYLVSNSMAEVNLSTSGCNETNTYSMKCFELRKDDFVILKSHPCKIEKISISKTGTEVHLTGIDMFSSQKYEDACLSTLNVNVPIIEEKYYTLVSIYGGHFSWVSYNGIARDDLPIPKTNSTKEIIAAVEKGAIIISTVLKACGKEVVTALDKS